MKKENLSIVIIGCGGFIGGHLLDAILGQRDWRVVGWDLRDDKVKDHLCNDKFAFRKLDYSRELNHSHLSDDIGGSDLVINLAAICNPSQYNTAPLQVIRSNFIEAYHLIDVCAAHRKWLIHFSTSEVYGRTLSSYVSPGTYSSPDHYELREDETPLIMGPIAAQRWTYACAKQLLERYIMAHHYENDLGFTIVRPLNFFGPRMDFIPGVDGEGVPRVLACFMEALMKEKPLKLVDGGHARRTILAIEDAIAGILAIIERPQAARGQVFNLGNPDNEVSMAELARRMRKIFADITGRPISSLPEIIEVPSRDFYGPGYEDCDRRMPNIGKAAQLLNWAPRINLDDALHRTIAYYWKHYGALVS